MNQPSAPPGNSVVGAAVELLYQHLHALPHSEYGGAINLLPFSHDSPQVRAIKRQACEAIVGLLDGQHLLRDDLPDMSEPSQSGSVIPVRCVRNTCAGDIVQLQADASGVVRVEAAEFIRSVAQLNPECPHRPLGPDDLRQHLEREFYATTCKQCGADTQRLTDGICADCTAKNDKGNPT